MYVDGFLWLAYREYEYNYTTIRWTWYIVIRALVLFLLPFSLNSNFISLGYHFIYIDLVHLIFGIVPIIDFIQFVYYARKFYLHLKSREKKIRLFYFDKKAYLDSKYLRIHFKVATILVGIALFFSTFSSFVNVFIIPYDLSYYTNISQQLQHIRHGVKPFQKGLSPRPRHYQKGLSPSPFSKPFLKKGLSPDLSLLL